jgi:hypothetical protein
MELVDTVVDLTWRSNTRHARSGPVTESLLPAIVHSTYVHWGSFEYGYCFVLRILIDTNSYHLVIAVCFGWYDWGLIGNITWGRPTLTSV